MGTNSIERRRREAANARYHESRESIPPEIRRLIGDALAAPAVPNVESFATRDLYPECTDCLQSSIGWQGGGPQSPAALLWARDADLVTAYRLAYGLGLFEPTHDDRGVRRDRAWLRSLDSESARVALAILGECDWQSASPRERAGFLLGRLVEARRAVVAS